MDNSPAATILVLFYVTHTLQLWFDLGLKGEGNGSITRELIQKQKD